MKKLGCGKKPASKGYRMSRGGGVRRYAEGGPADIGARPDKPSPEVMKEMAKQRARNQQGQAAIAAEQANRQSGKMSPAMQRMLIQKMREEAMDRNMQNAAKKPPNQRGYSDGGQIKRKLLKALMARRGR